jgi:Asp-tRNA(Asn)/Glu-tRNA(Gln) amidotransferase A subunit family amidase
VAIDGDRLIEQARALDALRPTVKAGLPLFGELVGVKDNMDTADLPTGYGSLIYADHRPANDAALVAQLRAAGALVAGKTACAEFAWMTPPATENPVAPGRTPGGSSSGSAAAVAAGHVRLATGTQTAGSINRPASYCGIVGFKPSFGRLSRDGVKVLSPALDTVGYLAASVADVQRALGRPARSTAPVPGRVAFLQTPDWELVASEARAAIEAVAERMAVAPVAAPDGYAELCEAQRTIQLYDSARALAGELERNADRLSGELREALVEGAALRSEDRAEADCTLRRYAPALTGWLAGFDAVLTPSADGPPPAGLQFTGDPRFSRVWTLIGAPCLSLPLAWTTDRLPVGVQLVGAPGSDDLVLERGLALSS